jgi:hypothetical protein
VLWRDEWGRARCQEVVALPRRGLGKGVAASTNSPRLSPMSSASYEAVAVQELGSDPPNAVLMARVKELEARAATLVRTPSS